MGDTLAALESKKTSRMLEGLIAKQQSYVRPFVENIDMINELYNNPMELVFDSENIYSLFQDSIKGIRHILSGCFYSDTG